MHKEFEVHKLNIEGTKKAGYIADYFNSLLDILEQRIGGEGTEMAIVRTKLEEACFFAKKAMATRPENQL